MQRDSTALHGEGNLDLIGTLRVLRQRAPLIAMCVLLTGGAAFALSKRAPHRPAVQSDEIEHAPATLRGKAVFIAIAQGVLERLTQLRETGKLGMDDEEIRAMRKKVHELIGFAGSHGYRRAELVEMIQRAT